MEEFPLNDQLINKTLQFVETSSTLAKRALDEVGVHRQAQEKAAKLRPFVLQAMLDTGLAASHQKEAADAMLGSHAETLQLFKLACDKIAELKKGQTTKVAGDLGKAVSEKAAGVGESVGSAGAGEYDSLTDPHVGRKTSYKKASDEALARGAR